MTEKQLALRPRTNAYEGLTRCAQNLVNGFGLLPDGTCELSHNGFSMWYSDGSNGSCTLEFALESAFPLGKMELWNYNRIDADGTDYTPCGMREVAFYTSVDGSTWRQLQGKGYPYVLARATGKAHMRATNLVGGAPVDFEGVTAQYIRLVCSSTYDAEGRFHGACGLAGIRLWAGCGLYVQPAQAWTDLLAQRSGWAGADGIFSVSLDGKDHCAGTGTSMLMFGDTLLGAVKPGTDERTADTVMVNNSCCFLHGSRPQKENARFCWGAAADGAPASLLRADAEKLQTEPGVFFWLQDGLVADGRYHCFPLLVREDPDGVEGYQFSVEGVAYISAPIQNDTICWSELTQRRTPLAHTDAEGRQTLFGGAIFSNTQQAAAPSPDGYYYIYGYRANGFQKDLCVCRIAQQSFPDLSCAEYYDGAQWVAQIEKAAVICENVSCEMSLSPYFGRLYQGKYLLVYQHYTNAPLVCCRVADTPWGPFHEPVQLYHCPEPQLGNSIYTYNAKGHPHLSAAQSLLVSYNVNACSLSANYEHAMIYSPRFLELRESL